MKFQMKIQTSVTDEDMFEMCELRTYNQKKREKKAIRNEIGVRNRTECKAGKLFGSDRPNAVVAILFRHSLPKIYWNFSEKVLDIKVFYTNSLTSDNEILCIINIRIRNVFNGDILYDCYRNVGQLIFGEA